SAVEQTQESAPITQASSSKISELTDDFLAELIAQLETQNPRLAAALETATFVRSENKITFYVPESSFQMMRLSARDQSDLQALLQKRMSPNIVVEVEKGQPPVEKPVQRVATPETLVQNDPMVQEFVKTFKGKINKIELKSKA
ncbi:MAG: hypothetical protein C5B54_05980, partial [Acidobacteria bacterium]